MSEESVSAGVRRIVAYTGAKAKDNQTQLMASATALAKKLGVSVSGLPLAAATLSKSIKGLKKQLSTGVEFKLDSVPAAAKGAEPTDYFAVRDVMRKVAEALSTTVNDAHARIETMLADRENLLKQIEETKGVASISADDLIGEGQKVGDTLLVIKQIDGANSDLLKRLVDQIRKKASPAAIVLGAGSSDGKVLLVAGVSRDLVADGLKAGDIVKEIAPIVGGGGGGKPDLAQAGGKLPEKLPEALEKAKSIVEQKLSA